MSPTAPSPVRRPSQATSVAAEQALQDTLSDDAPLLAATWSASRSGPGDFGETFYGHLFRAAPAVAGLFSGDMRRQQRRLTETLEEAVRLAGEPERLILLLQAAGVRHHHYRVRQHHFAIMEEALIAALSERLGDDFGPADEACWRRFFGHMSVIMRRAMTQAGR